MVANVLLMWHMFLGDVEEEIVWASAIPLTSALSD